MKHEELIERLQSVCAHEGKGYAHAILEVYATLPVGEFYRDLEKAIAALRARGEG